MNHLPNFHGCFVCGDRNSSGLNVRFSIEGDRVVTHYCPGEDKMGFMGLTHGGVLAALLDETMGWAPALIHRRFGVTVELTVKYLRPVAVGTELTISGWSSGGHRRIWEAEGEIVDAKGVVCAKGKGKYMAMSADRSIDVMKYLTFYDGCVEPSMISGVMP